MTDYKKATGSSATMMIRDTGSVVEFWINSNNSSTFTSSLPWGYTVNGITGSGSKAYSAGAGWVKLGSWTVSANQTVTFRIGATGTSGFGGPTTFSQAINRTTVPAAPSGFSASSIGGTSITGDFNMGSNGGSALDAWRVGWGTSSAAPQHFTSANSAGTATITGLTPGTTYYFWSQVHNALGWSPYGYRTSAKTLSVPSAPPKLVISFVSPGSFRVSCVVPTSTGGSAITGYQVGYGLSSAAPTTFIDLNTSPLTQVNGLKPGTTYYVWMRAKNVYGWGAWSIRYTVTTLAGVYIFYDSGTGWAHIWRWRIAVPYIKVSGVWKPAQPWRKGAGYWNPTL